MSDYAEFQRLLRSLQVDAVTSCLSEAELYDAANAGAGTNFAPPELYRPPPPNQPVCPGCAAPLWWNSADLQSECTKKCGFVMTQLDAMMRDLSIR
jgi:hypothetical protein